MLLALTSVLSFAPGLRPALLPGLRVPHAPSMLVDPGTVQALADATIQMPDQTAAASAAAAQAAADPGWFDL